MGAGEVSRARQRRRAVALWRYEQRCAAVNGVRISVTRPAGWLDDKPVWRALHPRRYTDAIRAPKPARLPGVLRRMSPEQRERVLYVLSMPVHYGRYRLYGAIGLSPGIFRVPLSGA